MVTVKSDLLRKPRRFSTPKSDGSRAVTRDRWFSAKLFFIWINKVRENLKFWYMYICITSFYTTLQYWRKYFIGYLIEELAPFTISTVAIYICICRYPTILTNFSTCAIHFNQTTCILTQMTKSLVHLRLQSYFPSLMHCLLAEKIWACACLNNAKA